MNVRIAAAKTPGAVSGTIISHRARIREAPSTRAASSRSGGRSRKNEVINQTVIGGLITRSGIIRAMYGLETGIGPVKSTKSGPTIAMNGNNVTDNVSPSTKLLPPNFVRAIG